MPVYIILTDKEISAAIKQATAQTIVDIHSKLCALPPEHVRVLFLTGHYLVRGTKAMVLGNIRTGATQTKIGVEKLRNNLVDGLEISLGWNRSQIWVDLLGVPAHWMYGHQQVLPEPGREKLT